MKNSENKIKGLIIIGVGIAFFAIQMGILNNVSFRYHVVPLLCILAFIFGALKKNVFQVVYSLGIFYYSVQYMFYLPYVDFFTTIVTCLFFSVGLSMIFPKRVVHQQRVNTSNRTYTNTDHSIEEFVVSFGEGEKFIHSTQFERASITSRFGEARVYFDDTVMKGNFGYVTVHTTCGHVDLFIPKNWRVETKVATTFGETSIKGTPGEATNTLVVEGSVCFGELSIIYV